MHCCYLSSLAGSGLIHFYSLLSLIACVGLIIHCYSPSSAACSDLIHCNSFSFLVCCSLLIHCNIFSTLFFWCSIYSLKHFHVPFFSFFWSVYTLQHFLIPCLFWSIYTLLHLPHNRRFLLVSFRATAKLLYLLFWSRHTLLLS